MASRTTTLREAAIELLHTGGPKHCQALTDEILAKGLASSSSKTPAASLIEMTAVDIKRNGNKSEFVLVHPGDGDMRNNLFIEHGIGVKRNKIEVLSVDADAFTDLEPEA